MSAPGSAGARRAGLGEAPWRDGTCAYCHHGGALVPLGNYPGCDILRCADGAACMARLDAISAGSAPGSRRPQARSPQRESPDEAAAS